jgi:hypothetical protein
LPSEQLWRWSHVLTLPETSWCDLGATCAAASAAEFWQNAERQRLGLRDLRQRRRGPHLGVAGAPGRPEIVTGAQGAEAYARLTDAQTNQLKFTTSLVDQAFQRGLENQKAIADIGEIGARRDWYQAQADNYAKDVDAKAKYYTASAANLDAESEMRRQTLPLDIEAKKLQNEGNKRAMNDYYGAYIAAQEAMTSLPGVDDPDCAIGDHRWKEAGQQHTCKIAVGHKRQISLLASATRTAMNAQLVHGWLCVRRICPGTCLPSESRRRKQQLISKISS